MNTPLSLITIITFQIVLAGCDAAATLHAQEATTKPIVITPTTDRPTDPPATPKPLTAEQIDTVYDRLLAMRTHLAQLCMWKAENGATVVNRACLKEATECGMKISPVTLGPIKAVLALDHCSTKFFGEEEEK